VDASCERSFLVRFGGVLLARIVGLWIAVWHGDVLLFDVVLVRLCCCHCLATKYPRCYELGDGWNCVM